MFTIIRRNERLPEGQAVTELRRVTTLNAARRVGYEVLYRFMESNELLASQSAAKAVSDVLRWTGNKPLHITSNGHSFLLAAQ